MLLADLLTRGALRARAGYAFERGERYWRQGRVTDVAVAASEVTGVVLGTERYAVRLVTNGRGLAADCTCPVGESGDVLQARGRARAAPRST